MGFSIAVDDVGAGYSGLEKIAHLNPRYLKFDMQLVRDIDKSHVKREMARALKTFADKMDSKIIAEGIEREGERQACVELGIDYGQGYLLGRPAAARHASASGRRRLLPLADEARGLEPLRDVLLAPAVGRPVVAAPAQARRAGTPSPATPSASSWA